MTLEEIREVRTFLKSKGLSDDAIDGAVNSISFHEDTARLKDSDDVKRGRDIMKFEPNPGKATLTQVGETQTYLGGDDRGLPIYQEDVDMIKKALPLAKRLIELQKKKSQEQEPVEQKPLSEMTAQEKMDYWDAKEEKDKQVLRTLRDTIDEVYEINPEELNMGPDTTENINEVRVDDIPEKIKQSMLKSQGIKKNETPDIMWYFDPESQRFKPVEEHNKNVSTPKVEDVTRARKDMEDYLRKEGEKEKFSYSNILKRMDDTHTRKNSDYGDAAYKGYKKYGDYYFLVQLNNKLSRLESLTIENKTQQVKDESIDDTLLDMANYAVMYLESRHRND